MIALSAVMGTASSCNEPAPASEGSKIGFALSFFRNVNSVSEKGENIIVSPYSAGVALSMLEAGAQGQTKVELDNALNGTYFKDEDLGGNEKITVESANSVWISNDFSVRNNYVSTMEKDFNAYIGNRDFSNHATVREMNNWCSENTNGKITDIIDALSPDMVMVLMNALYFNAPWDKAFNPDLTHDDIFNGCNGKTTVPMMYRKGMYRYAEYKGFQLVKIPYDDGKYAMYIALPPADVDIDSAVQYLGEDIYNSAMEQLAPQEVSLTMPKFKLTSSHVLNEALEKMGVREAFDTAADFRGISESGRLQLDVVKQKCYIDVSEKGTEAAAVTSAQIRLTSITPETIMNVDRPFIFMIGNDENVLFIGKIVNLD